MGLHPPLISRHQLEHRTFDDPTKDPNGSKARLTRKGFQCRNSLSSTFCCLQVAWTKMEWWDETCHTWMKEWLLKVPLAINVGDVDDDIAT